MDDATGTGDATQPVGDGERGGIFARVRAYIANDLREAVITAVIAFAVAWFINVYLIVFRYEGTSMPPGRTPTVANNFLNGGIFWVVLAAIVTVLITYGRRVGPTRLVSELLVAPRNLAAGLRGGNEAWALLLFGAALSLVVSLIFREAAAGISGVALLLIAASPLVTKLGQGIRSLGVKALTAAAGERAQRLGAGSSLTSVLGAAAGMVIAWQVGGSIWLKLVLAALAAGGSVLLLRDGDAAGAATVVLALLALVAFRELFDGVAFADDGGWRESGGTLGGWIGSPGSGRVMTNSTVAGGASSAGALTGAVLGQSLVASLSDAGLGGLSGEWGAQEAGADPVAPAAAPAAPPGAVPVTGDGTKDAGSSADPSGRGTSSAGTGDAGAGEPGAADGDAGLGGLSGQWSGDSAPPPEGSGPSGGEGGGAVPPPTDGDGKKR